MMKWSGGLVDGLSSSWTETTATEPLRCSKKLCILCVCMIILCSLKPHQQTCQRCLIMSTKNFIDGRSLSTKIAHFNYDCFVIKYPNLKWRQLLYVPICNGLLCSPSFLCNQTLSNIADMSAPPSPTLHQQTTSDSHNTPANAAIAHKPAHHNMFWGDIWSRGYRYADTFICLDHDPILRGLKTVVSREQWQRPPSVSFPGHCHILPLTSSIWPGLGLWVLTCCLLSPSLC